MSTIRLQTQLPFDDLLNNLHQLSAEELSRLTEKAATIKARSQQVAFQQQLLVQMQQQNTANWSDKQRAIYQRLIETVKRYTDKQPRQLGLCTGLVESDKDFDAPLPAALEASFWGNETDNFGISLAQD